MIVNKLISLQFVMVITMVSVHCNSNGSEFDIEVIAYSRSGRYLYRFTMGDLNGDVSYSENHLWPSCQLESTIEFFWSASVGKVVSGVDMELLTGADDLVVNSTTGLGGNTFQACVFLPEHSKKTLFSIFVYTITDHIFKNEKSVADDLQILENFTDLEEISSTVGTDEN